MVAQTSTQRATPDDPFSSDDSFITIRSFGIETFATGGAYLNPAYVSSGIQFIPALTKLNGVIYFDRSSWKRFWFNCKVHIGNDIGEFLAQKNFVQSCQTTGLWRERYAGCERTSQTRRHFFWTNLKNSLFN